MTKTVSTNSTHPILRAIDTVLNLVSSRFFGPLVFFFGGAGIGGYVAMDSSASLLNGAIYGGIIGLAAWFAVVVFSWFS